MNCTAPGCTHPVKVKARGLCGTCYNKALRHGLPSLGEPLALTGGRWVSVRGVQRWVEAHPQGVVDNALGPVAACAHAGSMTKAGAQ